MSDSPALIVKQPTLTSEATQQDVSIADATQENAAVSPVKELITTPPSVAEEDSPVGVGQNAILSVTCLDGAEVFVGGKSKGKWAQHHWSFLLYPVAIWWWLATQKAWIGKLLNLRRV